jgi:spore maturation protein CgeB
MRKFLFFGGMMPEMEYCFDQMKNIQTKSIGLHTLFNFGSSKEIQQNIILEFKNYNPDILVVFKGYWTITQQIMSDTINELRKINRNCIFIYWSLDDPFFYQHDMPKNHVSNYDIIFTCCEDSIKFYRDNFQKGAFLLYPGFDTKLWKYMPYSENAKIDFSIVGSAYGNSHKYPRAKIAKEILNKGYEVEIYGPQLQWLCKNDDPSCITNGDPELSKCYKYLCGQETVHHIYNRT